MADIITMLDSQIDPQIMSAMVQAQLPKQLKFTALAPVDTTLEGRPGTTVTYPRFKYIGPAKDFGENEAIDYRSLETDTDTFTIKKAGVGVKITDESVLSGLGDPVGEATRQIGMSLDDKVDNDVLATASKARLNKDTDVTKIDLIDDIEDTFGGDTSDRAVETDASYATGVLFLNPKDVSKLRKAVSIDWTRATELGDNVLVTGVFGEILGWQIVRSRKIPEGAGLAVKPGALKTYIKRAVTVEKGRDMDHKYTKVNADMHYGVAIFDDTKILALNQSKLTGLDGTVIDDNVKHVPDQNVTASKKRSKAGSASTTPTPAPTPASGK
ncbi:N4-gp56 family major capsid protein [Pediococcus pentosaceus]|uniref:N4-gp56 family major capsid protein n=1 Tax=Pediococcus pentosaceus TaxID=1255 RepID=UPI002FBE86DA